MKADVSTVRYNGMKLWWVRMLALVLAMLMAATFVLSSAIAVRLNPDNTASESVLGQTTDYVDKGAIERAEDVIARLFSSARTLEEHYLNASVLIGQARYDEALESIKACLMLVGDSDTELIYELWLKRGCLETLLGWHDTALGSFENIPEGIYDAELLLIKAQIYDEKGDTRTASLMLEEYVETYPSDVDTRLMLAEFYTRIGNYQATIAQYDVVIAGGGDSKGTVYMLRASAKMMAGLYDESISDFLAAKDAGYADVSACWAQSALASYLVQDYESVLTYGEQAIGLGSENFTYETLYYYMGLSQIELGKFDEAVGLLNKAIELGSKADDIYYYLGVSHMVTDGMAEAIVNFTEAINRNVEIFLSVSYFNRGVCATGIKDFEMAKSDFSTVMQLEKAGELYESAQAMLELL